MTIIYGVDTSKPVTSLEVRGAIEKCFIKAHSQQTSLELGEENIIDENYCREIVRKAFRETGSNYDEPNKESLEKVVDYLANFSSSLRDREIIEKHKEEIGTLIGLIK